MSLNTAEWSTYVQAGTTNQYGVSLFGWFPDYPDADDYTGPFYLCNDEWMVNHYCNMQVNKDIVQKRPRRSSPSGMRRSPSSRR